MLEILQFIFSSFWVFIGACFLLLLLGGILITILVKFLEHGPFTYAGIKRKAVERIINNDIINGCCSNEENDKVFVDKKIKLINDIIKAAKNK